MRSEENTSKNGETRLFPNHDNAPAHQSVLVKDFLAKNDVTTLGHSHYSHKLAVGDFYLFSRLKISIEGRNATIELKRFLQNGFHQCFQQLESR
jgi:hypothetical protein